MVSVSRSAKPDSAQTCVSVPTQGSSADQPDLGFPLGPSASSKDSTPGSRGKALHDGDKHLQLPLPLSSPVPGTTSLQLRFPWGKRTVEDPLSLLSYEPRELAYLRWVFDRPPISETQANHLLYLSQPLSYFPGKLIREGRSKRRWPTHGYT